METQQRDDRLGVPSAEATLGRDGEISPVFLGNRDAPACSIDAIGVVDEPECNFCFREQIKIGKGLVVGFIIARAALAYERVRCCA
jgi:hypothetical protein